MSLDKIKLPLSALIWASGVYCVAERVAGFEQHHGHPPDDDSTLAEWWAAADTSAGTWFVAAALTQARPDMAPAALRIVVEVAYQAAHRALRDQTPPAVPGRTLALVRRWLDGGSVSDAGLMAGARAAAVWAATQIRERAAWTADPAGRAAAMAAQDSLTNWIRAMSEGTMPNMPAAEVRAAAAWGAVPDTAAWPGAVAEAAHRAAVIELFAPANIEAARAAGAAAQAAHWAAAGDAAKTLRAAAESARAAAQAAAEAAVREPTAAWAAERAQQRADLDRLLLDLNLEGP